MFFWRNCSSKSWFYLVRHFTAIMRVWTCLSWVVVRGLSPWWLLVVAIEQVSTMQLFFREAIVWLTSNQLFPTDGANWWCQKSSINRIVLTYFRQNLHNTEIEEDLIESTGVVLAKYPLKVKLENCFTTLECQSKGKLCIPFFLRVLGFYSSVGPTFVSCLGRCFLMGKILINVCILRDSSHVGTPLTRVNRGA